jgi:hypothetical protein
MGCYVLLKSRLVKEIRERNRYKARQYVLLRSSGYYNYVQYDLVHNNHWYISFSQNDIKCIHYDKKHYYYDWTGSEPNDKVIEIRKNLANCRFDLVYKLMNEING